MISPAATPLLSLGLVGAPISPFGGNESPENGRFAQVLALLPGLGSEPAAAAHAAPPQAPPELPQTVLAQILPENGNVLPVAVPHDLPLALAHGLALLGPDPQIASAQITVPAAPRVKTFVLQQAATSQPVAKSAIRAVRHPLPIVTPPARVTRPAAAPASISETLTRAPAPLPASGAQPEVQTAEPEAAPAFAKTPVSITGKPPAAATNEVMGAPQTAPKSKAHGAATALPISPRRGVTHAVYPHPEQPAAREAQSLAQLDEGQNDEAQSDAALSQVASSDGPRDPAILQGAQPVAASLAGEEPLLREAPADRAIAAIATAPGPQPQAEPAPTKLETLTPRNIPSRSAAPQAIKVSQLSRTAQVVRISLSPILVGEPARTAPIAALPSLAFVSPRETAQIPAVAVAVRVVVPARAKNSPAAPLIASLSQGAAPAKLAISGEEISARSGWIRSEAPAAPAPATPLGSATITPIATPDLQLSAPIAIERAADFAQIVDRLVTARDLAAEGTPLRPVEVSLSHADFGKISLHFTADKAGLVVAMASSDPGFAAAVQAAAPLAQQAASSDGNWQSNNNQPAARGDTGAAQTSAQFSAQSSAQSGAQGQPSARQAASDPRDARGGQPQPQGQTTTDEPAPRRRGRFA